MSICCKRSRCRVVRRSPGALSLWLLLIWNLVAGSGVSLSAGAQDFLVVPATDSSRASGWILLMPDRPVARVVLDSLQLPKPPQGAFQVSAGKHFLQVRAEKPENWLVRDFCDTVAVAAGETLAVRVSFPEYRILATRPSGAFVFLGDSLFGRTPLLLSRDARTQGPLFLRHTGYFPGRVTANQWRLPRLIVTLEPDSAYWQKVAEIRTQFRRRVLRQRRLAGFSFAAALLAGVSSYYLKREANRSYDRYLRAGNPREMDRYFQRTLRFDRAAAGAYLTFEAGLLVSAYVFFRSLLAKQG